MSAVETAVERLVASFAEDPMITWLELPRPEELFRPLAEEASTPRSVSLYARLGFARTGADIHLPEGPALIPMWWHPRP